MNLNEFFTNKVIYKDTPLKLKEKLEQEISQASLKKKLVLANALANMVFAKIDNMKMPLKFLFHALCVNLILLIMKALFLVIFAP